MKHRKALLNIPRAVNLLSEYKDDLRKALYKPTMELIEQLDLRRDSLSMDEFTKLEFLKAEVRIWEEEQRRKSLMERSR
jgi:hypothetical protein